MDDIRELEDNLQHKINQSNKTRMPITLLFNIILRALNKEKEKGFWGLNIRKGDEWSLFVGNIIIHL